MWLKTACGQIVWKLSFFILFCVVCLFVFFSRRWEALHWLGRQAAFIQPKVTCEHLLYGNIRKHSFFFFFPYNRHRLSSIVCWLVAIVIGGNGKTQMNDEIINKWTQRRLWHAVRLHTGTAEYVNNILTKQKTIDDGCKNFTAAKARHLSSCFGSCPFSISLTDYCIFGHTESTFAENRNSEYPYNILAIFSAVLNPRATMEWFIKQCPVALFIWSLCLRPITMVHWGPIVKHVRWNNKRNNLQNNALDTAATLFESTQICKAAADQYKYTLYLSFVSGWRLCVVDHYMHILLL